MSPTERLRQGEAAAEPAPASGKVAVGLVMVAALLLRAAAVLILAAPLLVAAYVLLA